MSSLLNPLHPLALFTQKKIGQLFLDSLQVTLPPNSDVTIRIAPPQKKIWVNAISSFSTPRDATTGNPIITPGIYAYARHSMLAGYNNYFALESNNRFAWANQIDLRVQDPLVMTLTNTTGYTIYFDLTLSCMEMLDTDYDRYNQLWDGLYNLEWLLGGLQPSDTDGLTAVLKTLPATSTVVVAGGSATVSTPSMKETLNKIKRIQIP